MATQESSMTAAPLPSVHAIDSLTPSTLYRGVRTKASLKQMIDPILSIDALHDLNLANGHLIDEMNDTDLDKLSSASPSPPPESHLRNGNNPIMANSHSSDDDDMMGDCVHNGTRHSGRCTDSSDDEYAIGNGQISIEKTMQSATPPTAVIVNRTLSQVVNGFANSRLAKTSGDKDCVLNITLTTPSNDDLAMDDIFGDPGLNGTASAACDDIENITMAWLARNDQ